MRDHIGFPGAGTIGCSIFQQDKFGYLGALPTGCVIPTYRVELPLNLNEDELKAFLREHTEGCGWVVKPPFCTNCEGVTFCKTAEDVYGVLHSMEETFFERDLPYLMVQPTLVNRKEYKVVCLKRVPKYISMHSRSGTGTAFGNEQEIMEFARRILVDYSVEESIVDMLCRVDVMCYQGRYVVNELESFEALFSGPRDHEDVVIPFLVEFWKHQLMLAAISLLS